MIAALDPCSLCCMTMGAVMAAIGFGIFWRLINPGNRERRR